MLKIFKPSGLQSLPPLVAAASSDDLVAMQVHFKIVYLRWLDLMLGCSASWLAAEST
jgi:hypothetical protein